MTKKVLVSTTGIRTCPHSVIPLFDKDLSALQLHLVQLFDHFDPTLLLVSMLTRAHRDPNLSNPVLTVATSPPCSSTKFLTSSSVKDGGRSLIKRQPPSEASEGVTPLFNVPEFYTFTTLSSAYHFTSLLLF